MERDLYYGIHSPKLLGLRRRCNESDWVRLFRDGRRREQFRSLE
jgi:hypothetical protein